MKRTAIVTDSTADIPTDIAQELDIRIVPNIIVIDRQEVVDGIGISREEFYTRLPGMRTFPTTATASPGAYQVLYQQLFEQGFTQIISLHTSSLLSGIYNAASAAARSFRDRVHVIDSGSVSLGLGFQVLTAAEAALTQPLEMLLSMLAELPRRVRVVALLDTLEYLRRSGRVSWARARLGDFFSIKPIVEVKQGKVISLGETRTHIKGIGRLIDYVSGWGAIERLAILHTNTENEARTLLGRLPIPATPPALVVNITSVIGAHVGPNCLGFAALLRW
jgi:DegV family protein with EDD domain